jgi:hypothetical protein
MRRLLLVLALCVFAGGCANHDLCAKGFRSYWDPTIKPYMEKKLEEDTTLSPNSKKVKKDAVVGVDKFLNALEGKD